LNGSVKKITGVNTILFNKNTLNEYFHIVKKEGFVSGELVTLCSVTRFSFVNNIYCTVN